VNNSGRRRFAKEFSISKPKRWLEKLAVSKNIPLHIIQQYHAGRRECAPCVKKQTCVACRKKREIAAAAAASSSSSSCRIPSPQKLEEEETRRNSSMNKARGILLHTKRKSDAGIINAMTVPIVSESTTTVVQAEDRRYAPEANQGSAALLEEWKNLMNRGRRRWLSLLEENNHNMTSIAAAAAAAGVSQQGRKQVKAAVYQKQQQQQRIVSTAKSLRSPELHSSGWLLAKLQEIQNETFDIRKASEARSLFLKNL
jgi:hypothetical protein